MAQAIAATPRPSALPAIYEWKADTGEWFDPRTQTQGFWTPDEAARIASENAKAMSAVDWKGANQRMTKEVGTNLGIAAGLGTAQALASFIPTAQDVRNRKELGRLTALEEKGKLGLSGKERGQLEREMLTPVRALAHESRVREEELAAASGGQSVGALVRARREENRGVAEQARAAGTAISRANLQRAQEQMDEIDRRTSYKDQRQQERIGSVKTAIGQVGAIAGKVAAGQAIPEGITPDGLRKMFPGELDDLDDETLTLWLQANKIDGSYIAGRRRERLGGSGLDQMMNSSVAPS